MISKQIKDIKIFMSKLLADTCFDHFLIADVSITTGNTYTVDGHINKDFYNNEELDEIGNRKFSYFEMVKPLCYQMMKGHKLPVKFKFIFALDFDAISKLIQDKNIDFEPENVNDLFINIKYENDILTYTTGCSLKIFTMDKSLEKAFDEYVSEFISFLCNV